MNSNGVAVGKKPGARITIVLADDHSVVRQGLRALLEKEPDFDIVGEASNGLETLRSVEKLKPAVAIVDLAMPHLNGLEVTREITHQRLPTRVLLLSAHSSEPYVLNALKNGAFGYVLKSSAVDELVRAIRQVHLGRRYLPPAYSEAAVDAYLAKAGKSVSSGSDLLTRRERQILQMVAEGSSNAEIGSRLFISTRTVEVHRFNLMRKLSLRNSADLVRYALEHLPPEAGSTRKT
ncbi:MAG TPA: response regulator transcription factor [Candidatus Binatia bacterium]|jgi:DNA-binding NarL/FixJ family response regulator|nr:response regulator transcription factor [Candidatus Binatia bacterium]